MFDHNQPNFADRHIGPDADAVATMLKTIGVGSLDELADKALPTGILDALSADGIAPGLDILPQAASEEEALAQLRELADTNTVAVSMIGQGYFDTLTPPVLRRNILENPAWYTAYTPYQPEISQGRLEALLNFQTMVADLTGLEVANASMLDEGTAAAEAMTLMHRAVRGPSNRLAVDTDVYRQTAAVLATRAAPLGIEIVTTDLRKGLPDGDFFGVITQLPGASGRVNDWTDLVDQAHERGALVAVGADLLALTLITPPGDIGADVAFGTTQRFGVPMGFGGPHAGYLAVHAKHARQLPGRLVGVSVDADGSRAFRLSLQTREQHIRRDKATSNICTAQVLLAVIAAMYASYHGADGLAGIAQRVHRRAEKIAGALGDALVHDKFFDTVLARVPGRADEVIAAAKAKGINLWRVDDDHVSVSCDEATTDEHVTAVIESFGAAPAATSNGSPASAEPLRSDIATRTSEFLTHPAFTRYRTETEMMRYLRSLADKDIALDRSMIPLGSCTMKLNAAAEMEPITWPEFARQHPFSPVADTPGLRKLIADLETWLSRDHRIRRGVLAAQRGLAGGVRRAARHRGLSRRARRNRSKCMPHPVQRARHQCRFGGARRHAGRRGGVPRQRRRGSRRSARQGDRARGSVVRVDDYLSVYPRCVRARHRGHLRGGARRRRSGLRRRRQPQRAGRAGPAWSLRR